jgi:hypothetical protein
MKMRCAIPIVSALAYLIPAVTLVGCSEATAGLEDVSEVVGVYDLNTVAGEPPSSRVSVGLSEIDGEPVQVIQTEVFGAILTLELDRSFSQSRLLRTEVFTFGGEKIFDETVPLVGPGGTWSYSRPSVTLRYSADIVETGTVGSGLLTIIRDGSAWVYERR